MYIPWIAKHIVKTQIDYEWEKKYYPGAPDLIHIDLQGVAIGNGVIDSETQDGTYAEYAYSHGLIPLEAKEFVDAQFRACQNKIVARRPRFITRGDESDCDTLSLVLDIAGHPNEYVKTCCTLNGTSSKKVVAPPDKRLIPLEPHRRYNTNTFIDYNDMVRVPTLLSLTSCRNA
jgi:hypothetical protein